MRFLLGKSLLLGLGVLVATTVSGNTAQAELVQNNLTGSTEYDGWDSLTAGDLTTPQLVAGFVANEAGSGNAVLTRTSGAHYPASSSLYSFSVGSTFKLSDASSLSDVKNVVFSIQTWPSGAGTTYTGSMSSAPVLSFNGGSQAIAASYIASEQAGQVSFGGPIDTYIHTFQWDLSSIAASITSYDISWGQLVHAGVIALQLESSDTFTISSAVSAVPEPTSMALGAVIVSGMVGRRFMRRKAAKAAE